MLPHDWIDLGSIIVTLMVVVAGCVWVVPQAIERAVSKLAVRVEEVEKIGREGRKGLHLKIENGEHDLDQKFNALRLDIDNVKQNYARRDDLEGAVMRVERATGEIREDMAALAERVDKAVDRFTTSVTDLAMKVATQLSGK